MPKNTPFTRDEAILLVDTFLYSGNQHFGKKSESVVELSETLNMLPIHPKFLRKENFRNPVGISDQIAAFKAHLKDSSKTNLLGPIFLTVYKEEQQGFFSLHDVADAIKRNIPFYEAYPFGNDTEGDAFPEGSLLGHLHRIVEIRDSRKLSLGERCDICRLQLKEVYQPVDSHFLQMHLIVPPTQIDPDRQYTKDDFITVCPNCHSVLHRYRPWCSKETSTNILR